MQWLPMIICREIRDCAAQLADVQLQCSAVVACKCSMTLCMPLQGWVFWDMTICMAQLAVASFAFFPKQFAGAMLFGLCCFHVVVAGLG
jgi:hypothetical protein